MVSALIPGSSCPGSSPVRKYCVLFVGKTLKSHSQSFRTWKISDTSLAFQDIKVSIESNNLCTNVNYKPTLPGTNQYCSSIVLYINHTQLIIPRKTH